MGGATQRCEASETRTARSSSRGARSGTYCLLLLFFWVAAATAQSGRREPRRNESPPIQPPAHADPDLKISTPAARKAVPRLILAKGPPDMNASGLYSNVVLQSCADRLKRSQSVELVMAPAELNRKEASDRAKAETETAVALVELKFDAVSPQDDRIGADINHPEQLYIEYSIFTPGTGKIKSSGRVYQRHPRNVSIPGPASAPYYGLDEAARETADRILAGLGAPSPGMILR